MECGYTGLVVDDVVDLSIALSVPMGLHHEAVSPPDQAHRLQVGRKRYKNLAGVHVLKNRSS